MSDILKTNPTALHTCIYYEFLREKDVEEAYKNFCGTVGDDVIEYVDFEYWFYQFYHGNLDFDYDRSTDPKPLILTDLPTEMLTEIVGNLDILDRFNVQKVSRKFEPVVNGFKYEFEKVSIYNAKEGTQFGLKKLFVYYKKGKKYRLVRHYCDKADDNYLNMELSALATMLTNSKSPINSFCIKNRRCEAIDIMPKLIESLSQEVCPLFFAKYVRLELQHKDYVIPIISLFKPGVLEEIAFVDTKLDDDTFAKLRLSHLNRFDVFLDRISAEEIVILRDILSQFVNLKRAEINLANPMNLTEIGIALGIEYDNSGQITYSHRIPNAYKLLILKFSYAFLVTIESI
ncbi:hypothetical protein CRE_30955 [Caenorhabditis remanei]|uniref:F-box domain-containing protein n=1 Tax=Caenorhabditis remanei TaxID=31234 RepID=E3LTR7_CAERE|nr:hypothetical protein CRE_30955 [Caenorhabditis remanei]